MIKKLIEKLDIVLRNKIPAEYTKLKPPLANQEIEEWMEILEVKDDNFKAMYQWKNGEEEDSFCQMTERGSLISLNEIKETLDHYLNGVTNPSLIPLISEGSEILLFNNKKSSKHYGKLYLYSVGLLYIDYPITCYDSIEAMLKTVIESYETGVFSYDNENSFLDVDFKKFRIIAKRYNPESKYWQPHDPLQHEEWYEI